MRCYCKNCGCTIDITPIEAQYGKPLNPNCPFCTNGTHPVAIPDYETVEQWEKRTGRKYPDTAPVYGLYEVRSMDRRFWNCRILRLAKDDLTEPYIVATEAGVPPDDWRPEC